MQNLREQSLIDIWKFTLGLKNVRNEETFLNLGGDSLLALATVAQMRQRLGWNLTLGEFLRRPTIAALLADAPAGQLVNDSEAIIRMSNRGARTPIIFVHPANGLVLAYSKLANELGRDRGCYGIQSPCLMGETLPASLADIADRYADILYEEFGEDEFHLVGWSSACSLAFEIARCAADKGLNLRQLGLIDGCAVAPAASPATGNMAARLMSDLRGQDIAPASPPPFGIDATGVPELARYLFGPCASARPQAEVDLVNKLLQTYARHAAARDLHDLRGAPVCGVVLQSDDVDTAGEWRDLSDGKMAVVRIPGGHRGLWRDECIPEIAACLEQVAS